MKNVLNYYYNLNPIDIHLSNGIYKFNYNNEFYVLYPTNLSVSEIENSYRISLYLLNRGFYTNQIIPNNKNGLYIELNGDKFVLMKALNNSDNIIKISDIINFSNNSRIEIKETNRKKWYDLWINKLDYFEYQISQFGKKYPIIRESFSYYLGISETGITLLNNLNIIENNNFVAHRRINYNMTLFELYNPLNYIIDSKSRDISEYIKSKLILTNDIVEEIKENLHYLNLTNDEILLFYIRMFYCSFYFDQYEKIIEHKEKEDSIVKIINNTKNYELILKDISNYLGFYINIPDIEWIKKI